MKIRFLLFFVLFIFSVVPVWAQQPKSRQISNVRIRLKFAQTPIFQVQNVQNSPNAKARWLNIGLEYTTHIKRQTASVKPIFNFNDRFEIKFEAIISNPGSKKAFILSTIIPYWPIRFDGKKHYALVLIPPKILSKITSSRSRMNNTFLKETIKIKVTFYFNSTIIKEAYYPSSNNNKSIVRFFTATNSSPNVIKLPNAIFSRNKTPWLSIDFEKYELIKQ